MKEFDVGDPDASWIKEVVPFLALRQSQPPGVIKLEAGFVDSATHRCMLVYEFCEGGPVLQLLARHIDRKEPFAEKTIVAWACRLFDVLATMSDLRLVHCDISERNILLSSADITSVVLVDFGLSRVVGSSGGVDVLRYKAFSSAMSPEVLNDDELHTPASDVWAVGCVLLHAMLLVHPDSVELASKSQAEIAALVDATSIYSTAVRDLVKRVLTVDKRARITAKEAAAAFKDIKL